MLNKENLCTSIATLLMFALMVCLFLPVMFESSAMSGQDPHEREKPPSNKKPTGKRPAAKKQQGSQVDRREAVLKELRSSFVEIPAGEFFMGSENGNADEKPVHRVRISKSFLMSKYEVTQAQWQAVMGSNPSTFKSCGGNCPVENVSWNDVQEFIRRLNAGRDGNIYRLPTEAEWEYACRAGSTGDYAGNLDAMAWYYENSGNQTHPVGQKQPNVWGLYDMHGNVWEWCQDLYDGNYYAQSIGVAVDSQSRSTDKADKRTNIVAALNVVVDPQGPTTGLQRVLRGGSWYYLGDLSRAAYRYWHSPAYRIGYLGFRVVAVARTQ